MNSGRFIIRQAVRLVTVCSVVVVLGGCSFILSEEDEYRYRTIDYPVGEKQKIE